MIFLPACPVCSAKNARKLVVSSFLPCTELNGVFMGWAEAQHGQLSLDLHFFTQFTKQRILSSSLLFKMIVRPCMESSIFQLKKRLLVIEWIQADLSVFKWMNKCWPLPVSWAEVKKKALSSAGGSRQGADVMSFGGSDGLGSCVWDWEYSQPLVCAQRHAGTSEVRKTPRQCSPLCRTSSAEGWNVSLFSLCTWPSCDELTGWNKVVVRDE